MRTNRRGILKEEKCANFDSGQTEVRRAETEEYPSPVTVGFG